MSFREYVPNEDTLIICEHCGVVLSYFTVKQTKENSYYDNELKCTEYYYEDWLVCPICNNEEKVE